MKCLPLKVKLLRARTSSISLRTVEVGGYGSLRSMSTKYWIASSPSFLRDAGIERLNVHAEDDFVFACKLEIAEDVKGRYALFNIYIFQFYLIDLDLWNAFYEVSPWGSFLFTLHRQKKVCTPGDEAVMKIHKKLFSGIPINFTFLSYLQNYKEFEAKILNLQLEKYGLLFDIKKCTTSGWARGDENVIGIRAFKRMRSIFDVDGKGFYKGGE